MTKKCPDCGKSSLTNVGMHIAQTNCEYPKLSTEHKNILKGVLMGDGHIRNDGMFEVAVTEKQYLNYLENLLPEWFITDSGVSMVISETSDDGHIWRLRSVCCDEMKEMRKNWYSGPEKVFPLNELELNERILTHWYVCDGGLDGRGRPSIYSSNESTSELAEWFSNSGYDVCFDNRSVRFNKDGAERLMSEIEPVPGYEYKFNL